jgi:predicted transcriptional regulator YheO
MGAKKEDLGDDFIIERLSLIVKAIAKTFGNYCEVVLHDLRQLETSVVAIEHGHVTGRKIGSSVTNLALKSFREIRKNMTDDILLNYKTATKNGKTLKSTTVLIRNKKDVPVAALCINLDVTQIQTAFSVINELCQTTEKETQVTETFEKDINNTISTIIDEVVSTSGIPLPVMRKKDRLKIVAGLDEQGVFLVKGAIKAVASKLGVSKFAVYSYLDEIRFPGGKARDDFLTERD